MTDTPDRMGAPMDKTFTRGPVTVSLDGTVPHVLHDDMGCVATAWRGEVGILEATANARLIAEAFNVATETGMTPKQLLDLANHHRAEGQKGLEHENALAKQLEQSAARERAMRETLAKAKPYLEEKLEIMERIGGTAEAKNSLRLKIDEIRAALAGGRGGGRRDG